MIRKILSAALAALILVTLLAGCNAVGDIAGNVMDAAKTELENQVKAKLEEYKVDMVELKTAFGKLNDDGSNFQFFCAALVKAESDTLPKTIAGTMDNAGVLAQTGSQVESEYLVHKQITYDHTDFSDGTYYTIYIYISDLSIQLPGTTQG